MTNRQILKVLGPEVRRRRKELQLTVTELAYIASVARERVVEIEWQITTDAATTEALCVALDLRLPDSLEQAI